MKIKINNQGDWNVNNINFSGDKIQLIQCDVTFKNNEEMNKDIRMEECFVKGHNLIVRGSCNYISGNDRDIKNASTEELIEELKRRCD